VQSSKHRRQSVITLKGGGGAPFATPWEQLPARVVADAGAALR
jgi:hypothetical protein